MECCYSFGKFRVGGICTTLREAYNFIAIEENNIHCQLSSIGALIDFLTRERVAGEDGPEEPEIQNIEVLALFVLSRTWGPFTLKLL